MSGVRRLERNASWDPQGEREAVANALLQNLKEGLRDWVCWENKRQRSKPMTRLPYLLSSELFILKERQTLNL